MHALRCDYLAATARKFLRGPRGIGFLYVSDRALARGEYPLLVDMRGADWTASDVFQLANGARRFENWEFAYALVLGLGEAARYASGVGPVGSTRAQELARSLRERLAALPGIRVMDRGRDRCAIVTIATDSHDPAQLKQRLRARGINTSVSNRDDGLIDMDEKGREVRAAPVAALLQHGGGAGDGGRRSPRAARLVPGAASGCKPISSSGCSSSGPAAPSR